MLVTACLELAVEMPRVNGKGVAFCLQYDQVLSMAARSGGGNNGGYF
jgi:hypothetical protein